MGITERDMKTLLSNFGILVETDIYVPRYKAVCMDCHGNVIGILDISNGEIFAPDASLEKVSKIVMHPDALEELKKQIAKE